MKKIKQDFLYTVFNTEDITKEVIGQIYRKYNLDTVNPRLSLDGKQGIITGIFEHKDVKTFYLTQAEAEDLMELPE